VHITVEKSLGKQTLLIMIRMFTFQEHVKFGDGFVKATVLSVHPFREAILLLTGLY
jgi:hypothetical protein